MLLLFNIFFQDSENFYWLFGYSITFSATIFIGYSIMSRSIGDNQITILFPKAAIIREKNWANVNFGHL